MLKVKLVSTNSCHVQCYDVSFTESTVAKPYYNYYNYRNEVIFKWWPIGNVWENGRIVIREL